MAKVAINGLGRIGRATLKIVMGRYSNQLVREALRIASVMDGRGESI
jgi:glyceraldehyde-3-phosphate dehydrogenase/erythrose-4-phosphate dehydrogenase